jgi:cobalt/nickel transport system permease protein
MGVFSFTQIPLDISEGIIAIAIFNVLRTYSGNELKDLRVLTEEVPK